MVWYRKAQSGIRKNSHIKDVPPSSTLLWLFAAFVALTAIVAPYGHKLGYSPDLHMAAYLQVGTPIMLAILFWNALKRQQLILFQTPVTLPLTLFWCWAALSLLWAHNDYEGSVKLLDWGAALCGFVLAVQWVRSGDALYRVLLALFLSGLALALLGIAQFLFEVTWVDQVAIPAATFNNKNMAAQYSLLTLPLGIGLLLRSQSREGEWFFALSSALVAAFIVYTRTRAAWLSMLLELLLLAGWLFYTHRHGRRPFASRRKQLASITAILLFLLLIHLNADGFHWFFLELLGVTQATVEQARLDTGGNVRLAMWANTLVMIWDYLLVGVGVGNWMVEYPLYHMAVIQDLAMSTASHHINTHNDYLEITAELGLVGLALFLWLVVQAVRLGWHLINHRDVKNRELLFGVWMAVFGIALDASFSFPLQQPVSIFLFVFYVGILGTQYNMVTASEGRWTINSKPLLEVLTWGMVLLAATMLVLHNRWFSAELDFRRAVIAFQQKNQTEMLEAGRRAAQLNPWRDMLKNVTGGAYLLQKRYSKAVVEYEQVLVGYPHYINTLAKLGGAYLNNKQAEKAEQTIRHLVEIKPLSATAHRNLGVVLYYHMERKEEGLVHFKEALRLEPNLKQGAAIRTLIQQADGL